MDPILLKGGTSAQNSVLGNWGFGFCNWGLTFGLSLEVSVFNSPTRGTFSCLIFQQHILRLVIKHTKDQGPRTSDQQTTCANTNTDAPATHHKTRTWSQSLAKCSHMLAKCGQCVMRHHSSFLHLSFHFQIASTLRGTCATIRTHTMPVLPYASVFLRQQKVSFVHYIEIPQENLVPYIKHQDQKPIYFWLAKLSL